jgi:hypothetical protein
VNKEKKDIKDRKKGKGAGLPDLCLALILRNGRKARDLEVKKKQKTIIKLKNKQAQTTGLFCFRPFYMDAGRLITIDKTSVKIAEI